MQGCPKLKSLDLKDAIQEEEEESEGEAEGEAGEDPLDSQLRSLEHTHPYKWCD